MPKTCTLQNDLPILMADEALETTPHLKKSSKLHLQLLKRIPMTASMNRMGNTFLLGMQGSTNSS